MLNFRLNPLFAAKPIVTRRNGRMLNTIEFAIWMDTFSTRPHPPGTHIQVLSGGIANHRPSLYLSAVGKASLLLILVRCYSSQLHRAYS